MPSSDEVKNVLIVELNEFNVELLTLATTQYPLPSLAKVLSFTRSQYKTQDRYNSGFLEPWVQWVSIHAGVSSTSHQIKHLGDVPDLRFRQCWETLNDHNITTGIWGVMNGARADAKNVQFFLPDPWTFTEKAYPRELNNLLDLPRYLSKNYQQLSKSSLLLKAFKLLKFILVSGVGAKIIKQTFSLLKDRIFLSKKHYIYISYFDYISTLLFAQYKKIFNPKCSILFLNSLAHLQHHHWRESTSITPEILYGLQYIDKIFSHLFKSFPDDAIVVHNGLSQMNTNHEKPWVLYRQKEPFLFLKSLGIKATQVEQHMTHDGHVFFATSEDCQLAYEGLKNATINHKRLFHVEKNPHDSCKLFYQLHFTDTLETNSAEFDYNGKKYSFFKYFDLIVTRTGRHIPIGTIYSDTIVFPDHIYNHDFNKYLFHYLNSSQFALRENIEQEVFAKDPTELSEVL